jgi:hypothetical protein
MSDENTVIDPIPTIDPGFVDPGVVDPGFVDPGFVDPGIVDPGFVDPGFVDPGIVDPGAVDPAVVDPGEVDLVIEGSNTIIYNPVVEKKQIRVLFINYNMHSKNMNALVKYKDISLTTIGSPDELAQYDLSTFDCVYSPGVVFDISAYPNSRFIFGPHVSIFPEYSFMNYLKDQPNAIYVQPSQWAADVWSQRPESNQVPIMVLPFGVDTDRFIETQSLGSRENVFVYFKKRDPNELQMILSRLEQRGIGYRVFSYDERYDESDYLAYIQTCKYGIWIGEHESQGFALQEALSCNVPLLVWNVTSMSQEYGSGYCYIPASTIGYWDKCCGEFFTEFGEFDAKLDGLLYRLDMTISGRETFEFWGYRPRQFILDHLSIDVCSRRFADMVGSISNALNMNVKC